MRLIVILFIALFLSSCGLIPPPPNHYPLTGIIVKDVNGNYYRLKGNDCGNTMTWDTYFVEPIDSSQIKIFLK